MQQKTKPTSGERLFVTVTQGMVFASYVVLYTISPYMAHRMSGYFAEASLKSYEDFLDCIDKGLIENVKVMRFETDGTQNPALIWVYLRQAPKNATIYYNLDDDSTIREVVTCIMVDKDRMHAQLFDLRVPFPDGKGSAGKEELRLADLPTSATS
ncbi:inducible alternative oxidase 2 [Rhizophlyctis rosea]|uniref:Alternative oxidase n=1 Tax=Rhizophlyctis rosea TaxID=64517 RepID=A0AAD5X301_9FUNG|nr:inducible alternative oxidase 2 [Rhizophlyctis rosea]